MGVSWGGTGRRYTGKVNKIRINFRKKNRSLVNTKKKEMNVKEKGGCGKGKMLA